MTIHDFHGGIDGSRYQSQNYAHETTVSHPTQLFTRATGTWTSTTMSLPKKSILFTAMDERAHSASPQSHQKHKTRSTSNPDTPVRALSVLPDRSNPLPNSVFTSAQSTPIDSPPILDATETLLRATPAVVKARTGSVLARGFVLKTDYYPNGTSITNKPSPVLTTGRRQSARPCNKFRRSPQL
jgi:hypothetical protein